MTTFMYTTTSEGGNITNATPVEELVREYYFTVEPTITENQIEFFADAKPNSAFDVYETPEQKNSVVEEFLERLAEYLESEFEVRCVEVEGEGQPDAWKWTVTTDGTVRNISL